LSLETVLISAIEHYSYCPRQCGLIHIESVFDENLFTLKGQRAHARVDEPTNRSERGKKILRGLPLWSDQYGLIGKGDVIEASPERPPYKTVIPVEFKLGKPTRVLHASFQACAQAICLEEMFDIPVTEIALYYISSKQRIVIPIDSHLRDQTFNIIEKIREMKESQRLPSPLADKRCRNCSLIDACQPFALANGKGDRQQDLYALRVLSGDS